MEHQIIDSDGVCLKNQDAVQIMIDIMKFYQGNMTIGRLRASILCNRENLVI